MNCFNSLLPIVQVGFGTMGKHYLREMLALGIPPEEILVVDAKTAALEQCRGLYPQVQTHYSIASLGRKPSFVLNLVNSPAHFTVLQDAVRKGASRFYSEKPIVAVAHKSAAYALLQNVKSFTTCYLINFSRAVKKLIELMKEKSLHLVQGRAVWHKDRFADGRATGGDVEDELTHPAELLLTLVRLNRKVHCMRMCSMIDTINFVDPVVQNAAHQKDETFPLDPVSTASVGVEVFTSKGTCKLFMQSSFVAFDQERRVEVLLSDGGIRPSFKAQLLFDRQGQDLLSFAPVGSNAPEVFAFPANTKLADQLRASLEDAAGISSDDRLVHWKAALDAVAFNQAVLQANESGCLTHISCAQ